MDAFTDYRDLDVVVENAFGQLRQRAAVPQKAMAVPLDLSDPGQFAILSQVAPWTIHAVASGLEGELATFHDAGSSIDALLTPEEADDLARRLQALEGVRVVTVEEWRKGQRGDRRRLFRRLGQ